MSAPNVHPHGELHNPDTAHDKALFDRLGLKPMRIVEQHADAAPAGLCGETVHAAITADADAA